MAQTIMPDVLTDEEMAKLEASLPDVLTDEQIAELERKQIKEPEEGTLSKLGAGVMGGFLKTPIGKMASKGISDIFEGGSEAKEPYSPRSVLERRTAAVTEPIVRIGTEVPLAIAGGGLPSGIAKIPALSRLASSLMSGAAATAPSATTKVMEGKPKEALKEEAIGSGLGLGLGAMGGFAVPAITKASKSLANNIVRTVIRAGKKGEVEGFDPENMVKHNLLGKNIDEMQNLTKDKLADLRGQLEKIETAGTELKIKVPIVKAIDDARQDILSGKIRVNEHLKDKVITLMDDRRLAALKNSDAGYYPLSKAMNYKTDTGEMGYFNKSASAIKPELKADEIVYNAIYGKVKNAINLEVEKAGIGDIKAINKQFEEVIPINNAIARRIGTLKGNMAVSPLEILLGGGTLAAAGIGAATGGEKGGISGALAGLGTVGLARGLRSPQTAKALYGLGSKLSGIQPVATGVTSSESARKLADRLRKK